MGTKRNFPQVFVRDVTFKTLINNVNDEFKEVKRERKHLQSKYEDNWYIDQRSRRSLLSIVYNALGYLFGVTSEEDLRVIRKALERRHSENERTHKGGS